MLTDIWVAFSLLLPRALPYKVAFPCISVEMECMQQFPEGRLFDALKDWWFSVPVPLWTNL